MSPETNKHASELTEVPYSRFFMNCFYKGDKNAVCDCSPATGEQAPPVHRELLCCDISADRRISRTRGYRRSVSGTAPAADPRGEPESRIPTGVTRPRGNKGELYGGFSLV